MSLCSWILHYIHLHILFQVIPQEAIDHPKKIVEKRLRVFSFEEDQSDECEADECGFKMEIGPGSEVKLTSSLSSSSNTIFEESYIDYKLDSIFLLRFKQGTFQNYPFKNGYAKSVRKVTFEQPCTQSALCSALEYFQLSPEVEFNTGFFSIEQTHDSENCANLSQATITSLSQIKYLKAHCNLEEYQDLETSQQAIVNSRTVFLINFAAERLIGLTSCNFLLPNSPEIDEALNELIPRMSCKGQKIVDYAAKTVL